MPEPGPRQDPRFPGRPQHDDFFLLAEIIRSHDEKLDVEEPGPVRDATFEAMISAEIDRETLLYTSFQRVLRGLGIDNPVEIVIMARRISQAQGLWSDGFLAGVEFERRKHERSN